MPVPDQPQSRNVVNRLNNLGFCSYIGYNSSDYSMKEIVVSWLGDP